MCKSEKWNRSENNIAKCKSENKIAVKISSSSSNSTQKSIPRDPAHFAHSCLSFWLESVYRMRF